MASTVPGDPYELLGVPRGAEAELAAHRLRPVLNSLADIDAFAATCGPGLASSLMIGTSAAKGLAIARRKPWLAINHLEGHLLSPFFGNREGVRPAVALIVSGGHTLLA